MADLTRRGFFAASLAASAAFAAACAGTGSSGGGSNNAGTADDGTLRLQFLSNHPGSSRDLEQQFIDEFQAANSNISVELLDGGADYEEVAQRYTASLTGGTRPDIIVASDVTWFPFALNQQIEPLDGLFEQAGLDPADYVDSLLNDYLFDGQHYAIPFARSTPLFYYNKEVWSRAGLEDRGPSSWAEFEQWAPRLQEAVGGGNRALALPDGSSYLDWVFQGWNWSEGGAYSDGWNLRFTSPETIAATTSLQRVVRDFGVLASEPENDFSAGLAGAALLSTGSLGTVSEQAQFEVGTAFLPGPLGSSCPTGGAGLAIAAGLPDDRKIAALQFINSITSTANTSTFSQGTGYMPVRKSAAEDPSMQTFIAENPNFGTAVAQLPHTRSQDNARVFVPGGGLEIGNALQEITSGGDPATVLGRVQEAIQGTIDSQITPKLPN